MTFADTDTDATTLGNDILTTDGAIAEFFLGEDNPKNRGRVRALMCHIMPPENRMPSCLLGGQRTSFKSWITGWVAQCRAREEARARAAAEAKAHEKESADARHLRRTSRKLTPRPEGRPAANP